MSSATEKLGMSMIFPIIDFYHALVSRREGIENAQPGERMPNTVGICFSCQKNMGR
jgi:hypothetical protein